MGNTGGCLGEGGVSSKRRRGRGRGRKGQISRYFLRSTCLRSSSDVVVAVSGDGSCCAHGRGAGQRAEGCTYNVYDLDIDSEGVCEDGRVRVERLFVYAVLVQLDAEQSQIACVYVSDVGGRILCDEQACLPREGRLSLTETLVSPQSTILVLLHPGTKGTKVWSRQSTSAKQESEACEWESGRDAHWRTQIGGHSSVCRRLFYSVNTVLIYQCIRVIIASLLCNFYC